MELQGLWADCPIWVIRKNLKFLAITFHWLIIDLFLKHIVLQILVYMMDIHLFYKDPSRWCPQFLNLNLIGFMLVELKCFSSKMSRFITDRKRKAFNFHQTLILYTWVIIDVIQEYLRFLDWSSCYYSRFFEVFVLMLRVWKWKKIWLKAGWRWWFRLWFLVIFSCLVIW